MRALHGLPVIGLVALVGACGGPAPSDPGVASPPASPIPTFQATATTSPDGAPQQPFEMGWAQSPPTPLLMNAAVRVLVAELNVRERPSLSARQVGSVTPENILVVDRLPPFEADGYIWYSGVVVSATGELPPLPGQLFGAGEPTSRWFAAMKGSTAYVASVEPRCPTVVDLRSVASMLPAERLACFDDRSIELEGTFGCSGCLVEISGRYEPSWLAYPRPDLLWADAMEDPRPVPLRFRPSGPDLPAQGSIIRVRGHFRDDAATQCSLATFYPWDLVLSDPPVHDVPAVVARQLCQQELVVDSYEVIGTDPRFPGG